MVSFAGKLVGYKIVYMLMFLICLCLYQVRLVSRGPVNHEFTVFTHTHTHLYTYVHIGQRERESGVSEVIFKVVYLLTSGLLLPVEASVEAFLVACCSLHHAGAHLHLYLPV